MYTPPTGPSITSTYTIEVSNLTFVPTSPASFLVGDAPLTITAVGAPALGTYSTSLTLPATDPVTGGTFDALDPSGGTFTFATPTSGGPASIPITYTPPPPAVAITATYVINVTNLTFTPPPTEGVILGGSFTITATGDPALGTISIVASDVSATGGAFSLTSAGPTVGTIEFAGSSSVGTATVDVMYTPPTGPSITSTYTLIVSSLNLCSYITCFFLLLVTLHLR